MLYSVPESNTTIRQFSKIVELLPNVVKSDITRNELDSKWNTNIMPDLGYRSGYMLIGATRITAIASAINNKSVGASIQFTPHVTSGYTTLTNDYEEFSYYVYANNESHTYIAFDSFTTLTAEMIEFMNNNTLLYRVDCLLRNGNAQGVAFSSRTADLNFSLLAYGLAGINTQQNKYLDVAAQGTVDGVTFNKSLGTGVASVYVEGAYKDIWFEDWSFEMEIISGLEPVSIPNISDKYVRV